VEPASGGKDRRSALDSRVSFLARRSSPRVIEAGGVLRVAAETQNIFSAGIDD
jgi:hypothetical protein